MNDFYIEEKVTLKKLSEIIKINEIEFVRKTFLKGISLKKNEILNFETAKTLCKDLFNINILKKNSFEFETKLFNNNFYISIIGNVNSGKTTLLDFIFKTNISSKEFGKITQFVTVFELLFYNKKIFFFDLPGHKLFNKIIKTYVNISTIIFLIVSIDNDINKEYENIINIIEKNDINLIICINKIDKKTIEKIYLKNLKTFKISSKNGYGVKNLICQSLESFKFFKDFNNLYDGIIVNSYIKNGIFYTTLFLFKNTLKKNDFIYFSNEKIQLKNLYVHNTEKDKIISPCIFKTKSIIFPPDFFFGKNKNTLNKNSNNIYKENYFHFNNYYVKSSNHTIALSILDYYQSLKSNDKIKMSVSLGDFNETDLNYCINFKCKIILISLNLNYSILKKINENNLFYKKFNLISDLIDYFVSLYKLDKIELITSKIIVKNTFPCGKNKKIAGCCVYEGCLNLNNTIKIFKELKLVFQGKINSIRIKEKIVDKVEAGNECGILIKNFNDIEIGMKIISINYVNK
ncbi:GTP-binding protein [Candidatus Carsonella ruddii]|uniref:Translation initiation factor IF-2 n=1 Tax=Candidatus Carsonella ruddii (Diaphorina cf. continua) TaxID=2661587 RepID=A0A7R6W0E1_CARRU|nr:GTP-binding protein [Candidatus Carsonella ruddii (Diaphorina cf. continua)]BCG49300.1 translation initiation factor IF-2 [Candidatus Carsonella ruddii (Diaphorina cf. continua)]